MKAMTSGLATALIIVIAISGATRMAYANSTTLDYNTLPSRKTKIDIDALPIAPPKPIERSVLGDNPPDPINKREALDKLREERKELDLSNAKPLRTCDQRQNYLDAMKAKDSPAAWLIASKNADCDAFIDMIVKGKICVDTLGGKWLVVGNGFFGTRWECL